MGLVGSQAIAENAARSKIRCRAGNPRAKSQPQPHPIPTQHAQQILALSSWSIYVEFSVVINQRIDFVICR